MSLRHKPNFEAYCAGCDARDRGLDHCEAWMIGSGIYQPGLVVWFMKGWVDAGTCTVEAEPAPLPTFHAYQFTRESDGACTIVLEDTNDGSLSWTGKIGSDEDLEWIRKAIEALHASPAPRCIVPPGIVEVIQ